MIASIAAAVAVVATIVPAQAEAYYDIILANRLIGRLRDPGKSGSVDGRGSRLEQNITEALSVEDAGHPKMWAKTEKGIPSIYIGKTFLLQVLPGDAKGAGRSASVLAREWLTGFLQQFPRAQPVTKMGAAVRSPGTSRTSASSEPSKPTPVVVTEADKALVDQMVSTLSDARAMEAAGFEGRGAELATQLAELVWTHTEGLSTGALGETAGADKALRSVLNGLRYSRDLSPEAFARDGTRVAVTVVSRVRAAVGSPTPAGPAAPARVTPVRVTVAPPTPLAVPPVDKQLVAAIENGLSEARLLGEADFEGRLPDLAGQLADLVWSGSRNTSDSALKDAPGADQAIYAARNGLRYVRGLSSEAFAGSKTRVALTLAGRVRAAVGSTMPDGSAAAPGG